MIIKILFNIMIVIALFVSKECASSRNGAPLPADSKNLEKIYVDSVAAQEVISSADKLELKVTGNFPSPAYTFERFDVKVEDRIIKVTPLAKYDSNKIVAQMLVPFSNVCTVENLKAGTYDVHVYGRGDQVVKAEKIQVK